jgi:hypothetical protein
VSNQKRKVVEKSDDETDLDMVERARKVTVLDDTDSQKKEKVEVEEKKVT